MLTRQNIALFNSEIAAVYHLYLEDGRITREPLLAIMTETIALQVKQILNKLYIENLKAPLSRKTVIETLNNTIDTSLQELFPVLDSHYNYPAGTVEEKCVTKSRYTDTSEFKSDLCDYLLGRSNRFMNRAYNNIYRNKTHYRLREEVLDLLNKRITRWRLGAAFHMKNLGL